MGWNYSSIPKLRRLHLWSLGRDGLFHTILYNGCNYLSMMGFTLNDVRDEWDAISYIQQAIPNFPAENLWLFSLIFFHPPLYIRCCDTWFTPAYFPRVHTSGFVISLKMKQKITRCCRHRVIKPDQLDPWFKDQPGGRSAVDNCALTV